MNSMVDPLSALRDIHMPHGVSMWPPAPGWLALTMLLLLLVAYAGYYLYRRWRKMRPKKAALQQLQAFYDAYMNPTLRKQVICQLSVLLRRVAFIKFPRYEVAGLKGEAWLNFLNISGETELFTSKTGRVLVTAPYDQAIPDTDSELFPLIQQWIEKNA